jgi:uncharacterized protein YndB with AHSA1/START domain
MKDVQFSIDIQAPKARVWEILWQDHTFRQWASIIDPGTYMLGELQEGSEVQFISAENGYGVTSLVEKVVPGELLLLRHRADTQDKGEHEREQQWTGSTETYTLTKKDDNTTLTVSFGVPPELEEYFQINYPKALEQVKILSEKS